MMKEKHSNNNQLKEVKMVNILSDIEEEKGANLAGSYSSLEN